MTATIIKALTIATMMLSASASTSTAAASGCAVRETTNWNPNVAGRTGANLAPLRVSATASGQSCARASVVIKITDRAGKVLHESTFGANSVMGLNNAVTIAQMRTELRTWITFGGGANFHRNLPAWRRGQTEPDPREFPFTPAQGITRTQYNAIIANRTPVYCYVQGLESINCLVLRGGSLSPFGIQSFPG